MKISRRQAIKEISLLAGSLWFSACSLTTKETIPFTPVDNFGRSKNNLTIALLGATGMAGGYILREALVQGYDVRVLARSPAKLDALKNRVTIIKGDVRDAVSIPELLRGSDVVISALGPVKSDGPAAARDICTVATGLILHAMQQLQVKRYILVSGAAVSMPGDDRNFLGWMIQKLAQLTLSAAVRDKEAEYKLLVESPVQWTLVRCPVIEAVPYLHPAKATLATPASFFLRAGELARFVIEQVDSQEYIRKGPFLGSF